MKTEVIGYQEERKYYMRELDFFDGDHVITFNITGVNFDKGEITVAVSDEGRISLCSYELRESSKGLYFEYGVMYDKLYLDGFCNVKGDEL